jgi:hypothetical protein
MAPVKQQPRKAEPSGNGDSPKATRGHQFNADERARERELADVTIGELVFHRRRKNWDVTRALRRLLREQERAQLRIQRTLKKIDALDADAPEEDFDALNAEIDAEQDKADEAAYGIIALLLRSDDDESPAIDHLKQHLDVEDAGDLAARLSGGGEPDPTPTTPSS